MMRGGVRLGLCVLVPDMSLYLSTAHTQQRVVLGVLSPSLFSVPVLIVLLLVVDSCGHWYVASLLFC